jgi:hypothetical protein
MKGDIQDPKPTPDQNGNSTSPAFRIGNQSLIALWFDHL